MSSKSPALCQIVLLSSTLLGSCRRGEKKTKNLHWCLIMFEACAGKKAACTEKIGQDLSKRCDFYTHTHTCITYIKHFRWRRGSFCISHSGCCSLPSKTDEKQQCRCWEGGTLDCLSPQETPRKEAGGWVSAGKLGRDFFSFLLKQCNK